MSNGTDNTPDRENDADDKADAALNEGIDNGSIDPADEQGPNKDLAPIMDDWQFESGTINVRRITGIDGTPKIQMRLELGVLQMEVTGRPDGVRPDGFESLLEFHEHRLTEHKQKHGGATQGFVLTPEQSHFLREEAAMYYQRYLSMFVLGDFIAVVLLQLQTDRKL